MKLRDIIGVLERRAPRSFQEEYDNSGIQTGSPDAEVGRILVSLDVNEAVVDEAVGRGCQLVVSHHPLLFRGLKQVCGTTYQERCVIKAVKADLAIYSAHTSLDNAPGGVNHKIAEIIGLENPVWLSPADGKDAGSGLVGELPAPEKDSDFLTRLKELFRVECLRHSACDGRPVRKVALCGGAGAFLMPDAIAAGADCFICGEFRYHDYFENSGMLLAELGHYQSEQYTKNLLAGLLSEGCPGVEVLAMETDTNPILYL